MGLTYFKGMVGAILGYLGHPKVRNSGHVFVFLSKLYQLSQRGLEEIEIIRIQSGSCGVNKVIWDQYNSEMSLNHLKK